MLLENNFNKAYDQKTTSAFQMEYLCDSSTSTGMPKMSSNKAEKRTKTSENKRLDVEVSVVVSSVDSYTSYFSSEDMPPKSRTTSLSTTPAEIVYAAEEC